MQVKAALKLKVQEYEKLAEINGKEIEMVDPSGPPQERSLDRDSSILVEKDRYIGDGSHYESSQRQIGFS